MGKLQEENVMKFMINTSYSVAGFSVEFALLNPSGFYFYSLYSIAGYINPYIGAGEVNWRF